MADSWKSFSFSSSESNFDVELIKREVGQRFPFYDMKQNVNGIAFFCRIDEQRLEENFNALRRVLSERGYLPLLKYQGGEHVIYVMHKKKGKKRSVLINVVLLIATFITTSVTGALLSLEYFDLWSVPNPIEVFSFQPLFEGIVFFAFPLLSILLIHEMGHYFVSKRHGMETSLPFFMPIPPIVPAFNIGTFGALISSHDPMPNKKALFDVGIAGPLAGFVVALPVSVIGIATSEIVALSGIPEGQPILGSSLLFYFLGQLFLDIPVGYAANLNLIAFAGWVGLLITSINLLPAGQLDGGHIFRAFLGEKQKYAGWIAVFIMIFTGWWFFALIIVFFIGMLHPPPLNDASSLDMKRKALFFVALAILVVCFIPYPIQLL